MDINFEHLRPPIESLNIVHHENEILTDDPRNKNIPFKRNIFYCCGYTDEESEILEDIDKSLEIHAPEIPAWWKCEDTLRFVHEFQWDFNLIIEVKSPKVILNNRNC